MSLIINLFLNFFRKIKHEKGAVAIEYFVIAAVIIVGVIASLYLLRDQLVLLIDGITSILSPVIPEPTVVP